MWKEFREFIQRGNVIDLAVAIIIGAAFGKIVTSFVQDLLMPVVSLVLGGVDFTNMFITLRGPAQPTIEAAKAAGVPTLNYGLFIQNVVDFVIIAFAVFLVVKAINRMRKQPAPADPTTKECPFCTTAIPINAKRCPSCTSQLPA